MTSTMPSCKLVAISSTTAKIRLSTQNQVHSAKSPISYTNDYAGIQSTLTSSSSPTDESLDSDLFSISSDSENPEDVGQVTAGLHLFEHIFSRLFVLCQAEGENDGDSSNDQLNGNRATQSSASHSASTPVALVPDQRRKHPRQEKGDSSNGDDDDDGHHSKKIGRAHV